MIATAPLIIGAGPSGLAVALFLHERGISARVVDAAAEPSPWSKALGVNPRTLDLLEPSGVTAAIVAEGTAVERVHVSRAGRPVATIPLDYAAVGARWPLTILPQARTEMLLHEALARKGVKVERGVRLTDVVQHGGIVRADLAHPDGTVDAAQAPIMLGADGAHSVVRKTLAAWKGLPSSEAPFHAALRCPDQNALTTTRWMMLLLSSTSSASLPDWTHTWFRAGALSLRFCR